MDSLRSNIIRRKLIPLYRGASFPELVLSNIVYDGIVNGLIIFSERNRPNSVIHTFSSFLCYLNFCCSSNIPVGAFDVSLHVSFNFINGLWPFHKNTRGFIYAVSFRFYAKYFFPLFCVICPTHSVDYDTFSCLNTIWPRWCRVANGLER